MIDDFDAICARTPILADLRPGGRFVATDLYAAGGVGARRAAARRPRSLDGDARTVDGRTLGEVAAAAEETPGQEVDPPGRRAAPAARRARGAPRQPRPEGCVVKLAGHDRVAHRGPARVFDSEEDAFAAVQAGSDPGRATSS